MRGRSIKLRMKHMYEVEDEKELRNILEPITHEFNNIYIKDTTAFLINEKDNCSIIIQSDSIVFETTTWDKLYETFDLINNIDIGKRLDNAENSITVKSYVDRYEGTFNRLFKKYNEDIEIEMLGFKTTIDDIIFFNSAFARDSELTVSTSFEIPVEKNNTIKEGLRYFSETIENKLKEKILKIVK